MKKSIAALLLFTSVFICNGLSAAPAPDIDRLLLKAFAAAYPSAQKIIWTEVRGRYTVHFIDGNGQSVIEYNAIGQVIESIRYYSDPAMLPQNLSWEWHRQYSDKKLFGVTEVSDGKTTAWFLKAQDAKEWITVRVNSDGSMQVVEKLKKQL